MPKPPYPLPGRLRKPGSKQRKRREVWIAAIKDSDMLRAWPLDFTLNAARRLGFDLKSWLRERARRGRETEVLEIGCGEGRTLNDLKALVHGEFGGKIKTYGIDVVPHEFGLGGVNKYIPGDALELKFPKADFIFSVYALGYIGHPNVMVEKAAEALKPRGKAVLHFNSEGKIRGTLLHGAGKYFNKLSLQGTTRTKGTRVRVVWMDPHKSPPIIRGDWFVLIEKA